MKGYALTGNCGVTIMILSAVVNLLVFPLYHSADAMQTAEREKEEKLAYWTEHIKKNFKGDERYMMLQAYYREKHFKQTDSLKGTVSLLLQIPFFIAAYKFLSGLPELYGVSFGPLSNLGAPDGMLRLGSLRLNVMPLLMTGINLISGALYTKGMPLKSRIQLYSMAMIFLVLLYDSPSGLVFYWTLNNLFSLCKNIFYKLKNPGKVLSVIAAILSPVPAILYFTVGENRSVPKQIFVILVGVILLCPLLFGKLRKMLAIERFSVVPKLGEREERIWFILGAIYLTILTGILIPSSVVVSSPTDFINTAKYQSPLVYILLTLNTMAGFFLMWLSVFHMLAGKKYRPLMTAVVWAGAVIATINFMFFGRNLGNLSPQLQFDLLPQFSSEQILVNLLVMAVAAAAVWFIFLKKKSLIPVLCLPMLLGCAALSGKNIIHTQRQLAGVSEFLEDVPKEKAEIPLSTKGKNVIVFMLDRSVGPYVPYLFREKPELEQQFAGFTYYRNTVSMATSTNAGTGALFGGYEYSAYAMNARPEISLKDKQNEALRLMPVLFDENGFQVTVCDPPYAGYQWIGDLSIYDDHPDIRAYHTIGQFNDHSKSATEDTRRRNFIGYSMMKIAPLFLQSFIYEKGGYNNMHSEGVAYTDKFIDSYTVLTNLSAITKVEDSTRNTFLMIDNETSHEPCELQLPQYEPAEECDNREYEAAHNDRFVLDGVRLRTDTSWKRYHYYVDMAAFLKLGDWLDYLRENGVYDNTRIIISSDHGSGLEQFDNLITDQKFDLEWFMPVYMVKDFGDTEFRTSDEFMTNADTPTLAMQGLIDHPINPATGNEVNSRPKEEGDLIVFHTTRWGINENNGNTFMDDPENRWFRIHDNIYDLNNWTEIDNPFGY